MITIFFTVLEIILVGLRVAAAYLCESISVFALAAPPLTWACVIVGVITALFITAELYRKFKGNKPKEPKE